VQVPPADQFRGEVRQSPLVDRRDVRVLQPGRNVRLPKVPGANRRVVAVFLVKQLQRHFAAQVRVVRPEDHPHPAVPDLADELEPAVPPPLPPGT
jgi:hypothetical protein